MEVFVEECHSNNRCYYEILVSGESYSYTESDKNGPTVNYNLVTENMVTADNPLTLEYAYSMVQIASNVVVIPDDNGALSLFTNLMFLVVLSITMFN